MTNFGFDLQNTPDMEFTGIPDGKYPMLIDKVKKVIFEDGKKIELDNDDPNPEARIEFSFQVAEGSYQNARYSTLFNVYSDDTAGKIARSTIKKIVECCGVDLASASFDELENKIVILELKTTQSKNDPEKSYQNIRKVSSVEENASAPVARTESSAKATVSNNAKPSWGL